MTELAEAQAVAKVCDWTYYHDTKEMVGTEGGEIVVYSWPSLDAMHVAEKRIRPPIKATWDLWEDYCRRIEDDPHASASCRAVNFLRALNLWRYDQ